MRESKSSIASYIAWLEDTLIPDLKDSGSDCTAEDFEHCIAIMRQLLAELNRKATK